MTRSRGVWSFVACAGLVLAGCGDGDGSSATTATLPPVVLRPPASVVDPTTVSPVVPTSVSVVPTTSSVAPDTTIVDAGPTSVPSPTAPVATTVPATTAPVTSVPATSVPVTAIPVQPITIAFTGEVWPQTGVVRAATPPGALTPDFTAMFADIRSVIEGADLAICHLETPTGPLELVSGLARSGYDRCSTASERTFEGGVEAVNATATAFDENGMTQNGLARTPDELSPILLEVGGVRIAHLSYTLRYDVRPPAGEEWRSALIDVPRIVADATKARSAGAEMVVLSLHWGNADSARPTPQQRQWADEITRSGVIDLIVGAHSHVVQPIEQVNGVWVAFSLGNTLTYMPTNTQWSRYTQDGVIVTFSVARGDGGKLSVGAPIVRPTFVDKDAGCVIRDALSILASPGSHDPRLVRAAEDSLSRTTQILGTAYLATN